MQNIRATARPRRWRRPSGQFLAPKIPWIAWSALHHPLHESVTHTPQVFAGVGTNGVSVMPPWLAERTPAPPALTFVLPGKQRVNRVRSGGDLPRAVRGLPQVCRVLGNFVARGIKPGSALPLRALDGECDLIVQEIAKADALRLQRLRIERGLGEARQRIGLEINRPLRRDDEVGPRIAA